MSEDTKQTTAEPKDKTTKADLVAQNEALLARIAELEAQAAPTAPADSAPAAVVDPSDPMRPVTIELPYDGEKYKDDLYVSNGGRDYQIKRGIPVVVPYHIAMTIKESVSQDKNTARMIAIKEEEFRDAVERLTK